MPMSCPLSPIILEQTVYTAVSERVPTGLFNVHLFNARSGWLVADKSDLL